MSAFIVSKEHIDALVQAGLAAKYPTCKLSWHHEGERHELNHSTADRVGAMLWAENVASVECRYEHLVEAGESLPGTYRQEQLVPDTEPIEVPEWLSEYRFPVMRVRTRPPVEILKLISCFEYQSCEHEGWNDSEARVFCESLRDETISKLPGYDDGPWGV